MSSPKMKIGIVCSGGGMTCAYSAGALEALAKYHQFVNPHTIIAASGSAGNAAYYVAGQFDTGKHIWCDHLSGKQMINNLRRPILNINYLVHTVFCVYHPMDVAVIKKAKVQFLIPVINLRTGLTRYVTNKCDDVDFFNLLIAAKNVPFISGSPRCIDKTCSDKFIDGDIAQQLNQHVRVAKGMGCERIIVIDNDSNYNLLMRCIFKVWYLCAKPGVRKAIMRGLNDDHNAIRRDEHTVVIRPSKPLNMHALSRKRELIESAYELGFNDMKYHPEISSLLKQLRS